MILEGVLYDACGALDSVQVCFKSTKTTQNGVLLGADCCFKTQEDGSYHLELSPGYYNVTWVENGRTVRLGTVVADDSSAFSLPAALKADPMPIDTDAFEDYVQSALSTMRDRLDATADARAGAEAARAGAESAVAGAVDEARAASAGYYSTVSEGLANTTSGQYFQVPEGGYLQLYRNESGAAARVMRLASQSALEDIASIPDPLLTSLLFS